MDDEKINELGLLSGKRYKEVLESVEAGRRMV